MQIEEAKKEYQRLKKVLAQWEKEYKSMPISAHKSRLYQEITELEQKLFSMRSSWGESELENGGGQS
jgi:hypothetical protein